MSVVRRKWQEAEPAFGAWLALPCPALVEIVSEGHWDYVCLDMQHGLFSYSELVDSMIALRHVETDVLVRVPSNDSGLIGRVLDAGAAGIIVPMVEDPTDVVQVLRACRYPPGGARSYGPVRAARVLGARDPETLGNVLCIAMIETLVGIESLQDICRVEGLDAIYVGPGDLAVSMGLPPGLNRPEQAHKDAVASIADVASRLGVPAGIQCTSVADGKEKIGGGFQFVTVWKDTSELLRSIRLAREELGMSPDLGMLKGYT